MRLWSTCGVAALVGAASFFAATNLPGRVVHAQAAYAYAPGCIASVPKSWGSFRGISDQGMAFEDAEGTVRVIAHPMCGNGLSQVPAPTPDLEIRRP